MRRILNYYFYIMFLRTFFLFGLIGHIGFSAEIQSKFLKREIPYAIHECVDGVFPRSIFFLQVNYEEGDCRTEYYLFDPTKPENGFREILETKQQQVVTTRFLTPLYGGEGVVLCNFGENDSVVRWFNALEGKYGRIIEQGRSISNLKGWSHHVAFETDKSLIRFATVNGLLTEYPLSDSWFCSFSDIPSSSIGIIQKKELLRLVQVDFRRERVIDLGWPPNIFPVLKCSQGECVGSDIRLWRSIEPCGYDAKDGWFYIDYVYMNLWYNPSGDNWLCVASEKDLLPNLKEPLREELSSQFVPVIIVGKNSVVYVGNRRFAVGSISGVKKDTTEGFLRRTIYWSYMLIEAMTGKVLQRTKPVEGNIDTAPESSIPIDWWSDDMRKVKNKYITQRKNSFHINNNHEGKECFYGDKLVVSVSEEVCAISPDRRYLIAYKKNTKNGDSKCKIKFRLFDGPSGKETAAEIVTEGGAVDITTAQWVILCSQESTVDSLRRFNWLEIVP